MLYNIPQGLSMKHNVVFLPIGDSSCGDAIAVRLWDGEDIGTQRIVIIDGGYKDDWQKIRDLVKNNFGAKWIDLVISTHPDQDHIGGLTGVIENLAVRQLWMHLPWNHSDEYLNNRQDEFRSMTATNWLKNSLNASNDLQLAAEANNVPIEEPFAGKQFITPYGTLTILSPSVDFYEELLPQILDKSAEKSQRLQTASTLTSLSDLFGKAKDAVMNAIESHHIETLTNSGSTSPSNNSSTVMLLELTSGKKLSILLTTISLHLAISQANWALFKFRTMAADRMSAQMFLISFWVLKPHKKILKGVRRMSQLLQTVRRTATQRNL